MSSEDHVECTSWCRLMAKKPADRVRKLISQDGSPKSSRRGEGFQGVGPQIPLRHGEISMEISGKFRELVGSNELSWTSPCSTKFVSNPIEGLGRLYASVCALQLLQ